MTMALSPFASWYFIAVEALGDEHFCPKYDKPMPPEKMVSINLDAKPPCGTPTDSDGDLITDDRDKCPHTPCGCTNLVNRDEGSPRYGCAESGALFGGGFCAETPNALLNTKGMEAGGSKADTDRSFYLGSIPIGHEFGDTLKLEVRAFLPKGWSYTISDTVVLKTPDTIWVALFHDRIIGCSDTGRVIVYAYTPSGEFAGNAEITAFSLGRKGDIDNNDTLNVADISSLVSYLFRFGPSPTVLETAELTNDGQIDIGDLCKLVDHLYVSRSPLVCTKEPELHGQDVHMNATFLNDSTTIFVNSPVRLRGFELGIKGPTGARPVRFVDSLGLVYRQIGDSLRIGLVDTNGRGGIGAGTLALLKLQGLYSLCSAIVTDDRFHSITAHIGSLDYAKGDPSILPKEYALDQNFPNPFNSSTIIKYALPKSSVVNLRVYTILGQEVRTLVDELQDAGFKTLVWDGKSNRGNHLATGVYIYRLEAGSAGGQSSFLSIRKMMLLK
jgi:hypothetical protein